MGDLVSFTVDLKLTLDQRLRSKRDRADVAVYQYAELIMTKAKQLCPVDTGYLRSTGHVEQPERRGSDTVVRLGFAADYAIFVHENLLARHPSGQAKYLEQPLTEDAPGLAAFVAEAIR